MESFWNGFSGWEWGAQCYPGLLPLRPFTVGVDQVQEIWPSAPGFHDPLVVVISLFLFNIYRRTMDEIIRHHWVRYHEYANDTQLYISAHVKLSNTVAAFYQCLQAVEDWVGDQQIKTEPWQDRLALCASSLTLGELSSLVVDRIALPQTGLMHNLGVPMDLWLLQMPIMARGALAQLGQ